ncbi:MAG: peptide deformylase [Helicobacteraceae bacterium]|jgi:peptide deformylase|nr:peptide deformylase [Helicobacteraceae bacterium]
MARELLFYPNKKLRQKSIAVVNFDDELGRLLDDMNLAMIEHNGVGLAAIQIGVPLRAFVVNPPSETGEQLPDHLVEIVNPEIIKAEEEIVWKEGCLSIPEFTEEVNRFAKITLKFQDRDGWDFTIEAEGLMAIAIQHEMDHLDGKLFVDRLPLLKRKKFEKEWKRTLKANGKQ